MATSPRCPHLSALLADAPAARPALAQYAAIARWSVHRPQRAAPPAKRRKIAAPACATCALALARPFACLHCDFVGCWADGHAAAHLVDAGHAFCADAKTGAVFCAACDDVVYDPALDDARAAAVLGAEEKETRFQVKKQLREPYQPWLPDANEAAAIDGAVPVPCHGRRGLLNLGQTCFLNVVLQCLVHNPLLRAHFLSDKHNARLCERRECTCCELDRLFAEMYSGAAAPFGPTALLAATWRGSAALAGYAPRDAHETFIGALNALHAGSRGSTNVSCNCVVHTAFAGALQSDVRCGAARCGSVRTTVDPMLDVSLEIAGGEDGETLAGCLRRFTQPEKLSSKEYSCQKCSKGDTSKNMSFRKLPPVLSFQFKRFEHNSPDKSAARKIGARVRLPAAINMAPYTTLALPGGGARGSPGPAAMYEYDLFAVICHEGGIDNGHYINFARSGDEWYRFDDDKVTPATLGAVLAAPAYMCFYVKRHLDYKPYQTPTYILTREVEARKEEAREREKEAARLREVDDALMAIV